MEMDLLIVMGAQVYDHQLETFRKSGKNKRVVSYKCGNNYVITMENILFKPQEDKTHQYEKNYDEVWYIPQQDEVNSGYYKTLYRTNSIIVPFIWHEKFIFQSITDIHKGFKSGQYKKDWQYEIGKEKKVLGIMEPNLNIVKFCLIPTMIAEESYRTIEGRKRIDKLRITNSGAVSNNKEFLSIIGTFDLYKDKKVSAESRYQTAYMLTQHIDILICHQILNPLNYLYLDAAYLGYPVLHNAPMCKDLGYYYEGSDTVKAAEILNDILVNHDSKIKEYNERNDLVLLRYHADNNELVETYDRLIEGLFNGGNYGLEYNPMTNLYK